MALRVIVVGLGSRGKDWLHEIRNTPRFELAACVDVQKGSLQQTAVVDKLCYEDLATALVETKPDAIIIATPSDCHVEPCRQALSQRIAVLVEKPFTTKLNDAAELVRLAAEQQTPLIVAQNYRYMRSFRTARHLIAREALGTVGIAVCHYYRVPHDIAPSLARLTHRVIWGIAVHHLDMLRYVLNDKVTGVIADSFSVPWGTGPDGASIRLMLTFAGGARAVYSGSYESSGHEFFEKGQEFYARFVGARGTLHIFQRWLFLCENGKLPRFVRRGPRRVTEEQILLTQLEQALLAGTEPDSSGRDNLQTMAIVEACLRSVEEKKWINPQELLNDLA